jgi:hypothetical protein
MLPSETSNTPLTPGNLGSARLLQMSRVPYTISLFCVVSIVGLFTAQILVPGDVMGAVSPDDAPIYRLLIPNLVFIILFFIACIAAFVGYKLTVASGAAAAPVIPKNDYELLAPLVAEGKSDAIDQYVRLSSLTRFTGTFTQLGLTGLPLATIFLTLFFSFLALFADQFLDLAKLTLGAFIGSFVQRQVERQNAPSTGEAGARFPEAA